MHRQRTMTTSASAWLVRKLRYFIHRILGLSSLKEGVRRVVCGIQGSCWRWRRPISDYIHQQPRHASRDLWQNLRSHPSPIALMMTSHSISNDYISLEDLQNLLRTKFGAGRYTIRVSTYIWCMDIYLLTCLQEEDESYEIDVPGELTEVFHLPFHCPTAI